MSGSGEPESVRSPARSRSSGRPLKNRLSWPRTSSTAAGDGIALPKVDDVAEDNDALCGMRGRSANERAMRVKRRWVRDAADSGRADEAKRDSWRRISNGTRALGSAAGSKEPKEVSEGL